MSEPASSELLVAPCSNEAATFAARNWHYAGVRPAGRIVSYGAWEDGEFMGAVIYGRGATPEIGSPFGLDQTEICELVRVALRDGHEHPTSEIVAWSLRLLRKSNPGLRLVISFSDGAQGHVGTIYQATNWLFVGASSADRRIRVHGQLVHPRTMGARYGEGGQSIPWLKENVDPNAELVLMPGKWKYVYPLDRAMRRALQPIVQPYPKEAYEGLSPLFSPPPRIAPANGSPKGGRR